MPLPQGFHWDAGSLRSLVLDVPKGLEHELDAAVQTSKTAGTAGGGLNCLNRHGSIPRNEGGAGLGRPTPRRRLETSAEITGLVADRAGIGVALDKIAPVSWAKVLTNNTAGRPD